MQCEQSEKRGKGREERTEGEHKLLRHPTEPLVNHNRPRDLVLVRLTPLFHLVLERLVRIEDFKRSLGGVERPDGEDDSIRESTHNRRKDNAFVPSRAGGREREGAKDRRPRRKGRRGGERGGRVTRRGVSLDVAALEAVGRVAVATEVDGLLRVTAGATEPTQYDVEREKKKGRNARAELPLELRTVADVVADVLGADEDVGSGTLLNPVDESKDHVTLGVEGRALTASSETDLALLRTSEAVERGRES